jgi:hypothetical protein
MEVSFNPFSPDGGEGQGEGEFNLFIHPIINMAIRTVLKEEGP